MKKINLLILLILLILVSVACSKPISVQIIDAPVKVEADGKYQVEGTFQGPSNVQIFIDEKLQDIKLLDGEPFILQGTLENENTTTLNILFKNGSKEWKQELELDTTAFLEARKEKAKAEEKAKKEAEEKAKKEAEEKEAQAYAEANGTFKDNIII